MSNLICAFPGLGKTYVAKHQPIANNNARSKFNSTRWCDLDFGKVRNMFGIKFEDSDEDERRIHAKQLYVAIINYVSERGYGVLINDPYIDFSSVRNHCVFAIPNYDKEEWLKRINERGDDMSSAWIHFIYDNFDRCISEWKSIACERGFVTFQVSYLTDLFN